MESGDVAYLHDGTAVIVLEPGEGEPGYYEGTGPNARWVDNGDYKPARVARLVAEDVEQGMLAPSLDETSSVARAAAVESGDLAETSQYVHEPAAAPQNDVARAEAPLGADPPLGADRTADDAELRGDWESVAEREGWSRPTQSTQSGVPVTAASGPVGGGGGVAAGADATTEAGAAESHTASEGQAPSAGSESPAAGTPAQTETAPGPTAPAPGPMP